MDSSSGDEVQGLGGEDFGVAGGLPAADGAPPGQPARALGAVEGVCEAAVQEELLAFLGRDDLNWNGRK